MINRCHYCDHDKYPDGKPIDPTTDHNAKQAEKEDWKCSVCVAAVIANSAAVANTTAIGIALLFMICFIICWRDSLYLKCFTL